MGFWNCSMFFCPWLYVHSSIAIVLMGKRELDALLSLSSLCLVTFCVALKCLTVPWVFCSLLLWYFLIIPTYYFCAFPRKYYTFATRLANSTRDPREVSHFATSKRLNTEITRGIWKVLSMIFYLRNRFTNLIMFGIILKSYIFAILWHKFHEDIIIQKWTILLWIYVLFVYWKTQNFSGKYNILPFEKCAEH